MAKKIVRKVCTECEKLRVFEKSSPNHLLHVIITVFTAGIWSIIWLLLIIISLSTPYRCTRCGGSESSGKSLKQAKGKEEIGDEE